MRLLIFFIVVLSTSVAQAQQYQIGDKVVAITKVPLTLDGKEVAKSFPGKMHVVAKLKGDQIWVEKPKSGWLESKNVIPLDQAIPFFSKAIEKEPDNLAWRFGRATLLRDKGELDASITDLTELIRRQPSDAKYWCARG